jgi:purine-nucleoside phosphorylase
LESITACERAAPLPGIIEGMSEAPPPSERVARSARAVRAHTDLVPRIAFVLGSGLGAFGEAVAGAVRLPYERVEGLVGPRVAGHAGQLVLGEIAGAPVVVLQGRVHLYEGHPVEDVVHGVRLVRALGAEVLVLTNAAGGIDPAIAPGELMSLSDHLNLTGRNPLVGPNDPALGPRFPDMTEVYDLELRARLLRAGGACRIALHEGVYAGVLGPSYETPAEIRMLRALGASAVGMSTVLEAIAARHVGLRAVGLSCVTNRAAGLSGTKLTHEEVKATAAAAADAMTRLLEAFVREVA